jgi:hypothetical protein
MVIRYMFSNLFFAIGKSVSDGTVPNFLPIFASFLPSLTVGVLKHRAAPIRIGTLSVSEGGVSTKGGNLGNLEVRVFPNFVCEKSGTGNRGRARASLSQG